MRQVVAENRHAVSTHCMGCKIRSISVCAALADDELETLEHIARAAEFGARETLFRQGDSADAVYNLTAGTVRLYRVLSDGRRQILGFAMPGDFLGLAVHAGYDFTAEAVVPVEACRFARKAHETLVEGTPRLLRRVHRYASHELTLAHDQIMLLGRCTAQERVAAFLLQMRLRWAVQNEGRPSVTVPLPMGRQDIADYLGLTIETVSRTLCQLARDKHLTLVPYGVRISDVRNMEKLAAM